MITKNKEFIAYQGLEFTIEWYFNDQGKSAAMQYFNELPIARQKKLDHLFRIMGTLGEIQSIEKFRHEGDQIYVFKSQPDRFFCFFFAGSKIIVTNAYEEQSDKMPPREHTKAIKAQQDYITRNKQGKYYEKNIR